LIKAFGQDFWDCGFFVIVGFGPFSYIVLLDPLELRMGWHHHYSWPSIDPSHINGMSPNAPLSWFYALFLAVLI